MNCDIYDVAQPEEDTIGWSNEAVGSLNGDQYLEADEVVQEDTGDVATPKEARETRARLDN